MVDVLADRYELGALIGSGGLADVHVATDHRTGEQVAVKVLRTVRVDDRHRFRIEAQVLQNLDHPSIVRLRDADEGERPFLVLDLVRGESLADRLRTAPVPAEPAWCFGADIAEALAHAHAHAIVHRDVKPANVLLDDAGRARLSDFGIARLLGSGATCLTATNQVVGTPAYLAPEQVQGRSVTPAADVYALGLVLIESLTGACCFTGTTAEVAVARLQRTPPIPEEIPPWAATLLRAMVAIDPRHRPSASEVARCLREHDAPEGSVRRAEDPQVAALPRLVMGRASQPAPRDTVAIDRPTRPMWRRAIPVLAAASLAVAAMTFAIGLSTPAPHADTAVADEIPRSEPASAVEPGTDEPAVPTGQSDRPPRQDAPQAPVPPDPPPPTPESVPEPQVTAPPATEPSASDQPDADAPAPELSTADAPAPEMSTADAPAPEPLATDTPAPTEPDPPGQPGPPAHAERPQHAGPPDNAEGNGRGPKGR